MFNKSKNAISLKKFLKILKLLSQPEFPEKGRGLPKLDRSRDATGRINISQSFSLEVQADRTVSGFPKTF